MIFDTEPEIQDGQRAFVTTQDLFAGQPQTIQVANPMDCSWYGTNVDPYRGAFCVVQVGAGLELLVGEFVSFSVARRHPPVTIICYCLGERTEIPTPIAVTRRAWMNLEILPKDEVSVYVATVR